MMSWELYHAVRATILGYASEAWHLTSKVMQGNLDDASRLWGTPKSQQNQEAMVLEGKLLSILYVSQPCMLACSRYVSSIHQVCFSMYYHRN